MSSLLHTFTASLSSTFTRVLLVLLLSSLIPFFFTLLSPDRIEATSPEFEDDRCGYYEYWRALKGNGGGESGGGESGGGESGGGGGSVDGGPTDYSSSEDTAELAVEIIARFQNFCFRCSDPTRETTPPSSSLSSSSSSCVSSSTSTCASSSIPLPFLPLPSFLTPFLPSTTFLLTFLLSSPLFLHPHSSTPPPTTSANRARYFTRSLNTAGLQQKLFILSQYPFEYPAALLAAGVAGAFLGSRLAVELFRALPSLTNVPSSLFSVPSLSSLPPPPLLTILLSTSLSTLALNYIPPFLHLNDFSPHLLHLFFLPLQYHAAWTGPEVYYALGGRGGGAVAGGMVSTVAVGRCMAWKGFALK